MPLLSRSVEDILAGKKNKIIEPSINSGKKKKF
jgi:hypothetical protein